MRYIAIFAVLFVVIFTYSAAYAEEILLKYNLSPGEIHVYKSTMEVRINTAPISADAKSRGILKANSQMIVKASAWVSIKCISAAENEFICECRFFSPLLDHEKTTNGVRTRTVMDTATVKTFIGEKLESQVRWADFKDKTLPNLSKLIKQTIRCRITRNGQLVEIYGIKNLEEEFTALNLGQMLGEGIIYPAYPIEIGETWDASFHKTVADSNLSRFLPGEDIQVRKYTFVKIKDFGGKRCAVIQVEEKESKTTESIPDDAYNLKGLIIADIESGRIINAQEELHESNQRENDKQKLSVSGSFISSIEYVGTQIPKQIVDEDKLSRIDPSLLKSLNEIRVSIVLDDRAKIGKKFYSINDSVIANGIPLDLVKFSDDRIYLKDNETEIIYKILLNSRGEVTNIKPLLVKENK
jgi:hypothetical protein